VETDRIVFHGIVEKKSRLLSHPDLYTDVDMICFRVRKEYMPGLVAYGKEHDLTDLEITLAPWPVDPTDRAKKFFFALRDRLAEKTEGEKPTRQYKDHLYRSCVRELEFWNSEDNVIKQSLTGLDKRELWLVTELMHQWCVTAECDLRDLSATYESSQQYLKGENSG